MCVGTQQYRLGSLTSIGVIFIHLLLCGLAFALAPTDDFRIDGLYSDPSGSVSAVLQFPNGRISDHDSFQLLEDGEVTVSSSKVTAFKDSNWQLSLVICIDTSGSMKGAPTEEVKAALKKLLADNDLRDNDLIALRTFDDSTRIVNWFDTKHGLITEAIDELTARGLLTVLYNALHTALNDDYQRAPGPRVMRRVLVISDGKNEVEEPNPDTAEPNHSFEEVLKLAQTENIPIDFLARVRRDRVKDDLKEGYVQEVRRLSDLTGGFFEYAEPDQVYSKVKAILEQIMAKSVVNFERQIDSDADYTKMVGIAYGSSRKQLSGEIGRTLEPPQPLPPQKKPEFSVPSWLLWLLTFTAIALFAFLIYRPRNRKSETQIKKKPVTAYASDGLKPEPPNRRTIISSSPPHGKEGTNGEPAKISLRCIGGPTAGSNYDFSLDRIQIGSDESLGNDLCVREDEFMSAKHANIDIIDGRISITDLNTTNGILLNGNRLDSGSTTSVQSGDQLQMGMSIFEIHA